ncbi:MAG: glycine--tRNA ligase subunit beta, partial [Alphaproteobacteria bacterium]|nr:glycine--tRNA ligase subunit beta [Alphaproteobacteria bacterium]
GVPARQADLRTERRGPRINAPEKAIEGFLRSAGVTRAQCEERVEGKMTYLVAIVESAGRPARDVLAEIVSGLARALPWPKSQRWGTTTFRWVRPLHRIVAVFDGAPLAGVLDLGNGNTLAFTDRTAGHRFLAPGEFAVTSYANYKAKLAAAHVVVEAGERRATIAAGLDAATAKAGLRLRADAGLLDEVTGLVEWPVVMLGAIDARFRELPPEVLTASIRAHQKYFTLEAPDGTFASYFAFVANSPGADGGAEIVAGNERVLRARLSDARYFWDLDLATPLAARVPALASIVFHAKLGTVDAKIDRVQALTVALCKHVPGSDRDRVHSAARLAKADLTTGMVGEFPELQGVMGRYYALAAGEHHEVADAIADHYAPAGPNDRCPTAPVSVCVALADRIDTLVGFWAIGETPTGSRDPFALRRAALGVIRLVLENRLRLDLTAIFRGHAAQFAATTKATADELTAELLDFFADRLKVQQRESGIGHDRISAVFARSARQVLEHDGVPIPVDLVRVVKLVKALDTFLKGEDGANLLIAYRRAANIVRAEEKKDGRVYEGATYDATIATAAEEKALFAVLETARAALPSLLAAERFAEAMTALAALRAPVDAFFDKVTVNVDDNDQRANRLCLLAFIQGVMREVADFAQIEG